MELKFTLILTGFGILILVLLNQCSLESARECRERGMDWVQTATYNFACMPKIK